MQFEYHNTLEIHRHKMELLLQEKKVTLHNSEEDSKKYLVRILESVRTIKVIRKTLTSIEQATQINQANEIQVMQAFMKRQVQLRVV